MGRLGLLSSEKERRQDCSSITSFRINTCESVSEQSTLTTFRMNTYAKRGRGVDLITALRPIFAAALLLLIFSPSFVQACSCVMVGTGCGSWSSRGEGAVFLGKVTAKVAQPRPEAAGVADLPVGYAVHFSVDESFYGVSDPGAEAVVYTGSGAGDCGYPFVVGTSYLVYAGPGTDGRLSTGTCSGTKPEIISGGELMQLRAIRDRGHGFELFGTVFVLPKGAGSVDQIESQPLDRVPVRAVGSHGSLFSTLTDQYGVYSFAWLPPDTYHLEETLPTGFSLARTAEPQPFVITAADKQVPGFACNLDVYAKPDGQISGVVVDLAGRGVPGFLTLEPADPKEAAAAHQRGGLPGDDTEDGKFSLPQLPPGCYRLVFIPKIWGHKNFRQKFYWPPSNATNSGSIEIGLGQHIDNIRFEVPLTGSEN